MPDGNNTKEEAVPLSRTNSASNTSEQIAKHSQAADEPINLRQCIRSTAQDDWYIFAFQHGPALAFTESQNYQLGSGSFGTVYRAYQANWDESDKQYQVDKAVTKAVAKVSKALESYFEFNHLIDVASLTRHHQMTSDVLKLPNNDDRHVTLTEYLGSKNLYDCQFTGLLKQLDIINKVNQRLVDMHYPSPDSGRPATVHADIKPDNIVYNEQTGQVAITDFDLACTLKNDAERSHPFRAFCDIPIYSPPELGKPDAHCRTYLERRSDVYSLTSVIVQVLGVDYKKNGNLKKFPIDQVNLTGWDDNDFSLDTYLKHFLNTMQSQSPSQRPTSKQVQYFFDNVYHYCEIKNKEIKGSSLTEQEQQNKQQYKAKMIGLSSKLAEFFVSHDANVFETLFNQLKDEQKILYDIKTSFHFSLFSTPSLHHRLLAINDFIGLTKATVTGQKLTKQEDQPYKQGKGYSGLHQEMDKNSQPKSKLMLDNAYQALTRKDDQIADIVSELSKTYNLSVSEKHKINLDGKEPSKTFSA